MDSRPEKKLKPSYREKWKPNRKRSLEEAIIISLKPSMTSLEGYPFVYLRITEEPTLLKKTTIPHKDSKARILLISSSSSAKV